MEVAGKNVLVVKNGISEHGSALESGGIYGSIVKAAGKNLLSWEMAYLKVVYL